MSKDVANRVRTGFNKQGFMTSLGAELKEIDPGVCRVVLPFSDRLTQQHGFFHGGVTTALADTAAGFAGYSLMRSDEQPLSVELKVNFLAPARGETLDARAKVVRAGRRLKHVYVEVFAIEREVETLVAIALATVTATRSVQEMG